MCPEQGGQVERKDDPGAGRARQRVGRELHHGAAPPRRRKARGKGEPHCRAVGGEDVHVQRKRAAAARHPELHVNVPPWKPERRAALAWHGQSRGRLERSAAQNEDAPPKQPVWPLLHVAREADVDPLAILKRPEHVLRPGLGGGIRDGGLHCRRHSEERVALSAKGAKKENQV